MSRSCLLLIATALVACAWAQEPILDPGPLIPVMLGNHFQNFDDVEPDPDNTGPADEVPSNVALLQTGTEVATVTKPTEFYHPLAWLAAGGVAHHLMNGGVGAAAPAPAAPVPVDTRDRDVCGVVNGDGSSCTDQCGVVNGDGTTCTPDACGVVNGDGSSCTDQCGVVNGDGTTCTPDACGVVNGDGSSCTDLCGVVNGDGSSCTGTPSMGFGQMGGMTTTPGMMGIPQMHGVPAMGGGLGGGLGAPSTMGGLGQLGMPQMMGMPSMGQMATPSMGQMGMPSMGQMGMPSMGQMGMPSMGQMGMPMGAMGPQGMQMPNFVQSGHGSSIFQNGMMPSLMQSDMPNNGASINHMLLQSHAGAGAKAQFYGAAAASPLAVGAGLTAFALNPYLVGAMAPYMLLGGLF